MTAVDLRRRLRDKSVLIFSLAVPLALMTVLNLLLGGATEGELEPVDLAVSAPEHDELAGVLVLALTDSGAVGVTAVETDDPQAAGEAGSADGRVGIPDGFNAAAISRRH